MLKLSLHAYEIDGLRRSAGILQATIAELGKL
jgi:hypothetical protein